MGRAYSIDLRERVLKEIDGGMSTEDAARKYSVSISWTYLLKKQRRETGSIAPKEHQGGPKLKLAPYEKEVRQPVADHADATLEELHAMLPNKDAVTVVTLHSFLKRLKISKEKRRSAPLNNIDRTSSNSGRTGDGSKNCSIGKNSFSSTKCLSLATPPL